MNNQIDLTKFEFLFSLDDNIICQRFFNVKNHNPLSKRSMNLHEVVKKISEEIADDLRIKSSDYLCENKNFILQNENVEEVVYNEKEFFTLKIKQDDDVFISRIIPAHLYHPKVRYTVDIRPKIKEILAELSSVLASKDLETTYLGYDLQIK